jgi:hypothetical protein
MQNQKIEHGSGLRAATNPQKNFPKGRRGPASLFRFDRQDLPAFVITARRTGCVRGDGASALRAFIELRRLPAVRRLPCAQPHLRSFAFGNSHKGNQESRKSGKDNGEALNRESLIVNRDPM